MFAERTGDRISLRSDAGAQEAGDGGGGQSESCVALSLVDGETKRTAESIIALGNDH